MFHKKNIAVLSPDQEDARGFKGYARSYDVYDSIGGKKNRLIISTSDLTMFYYDDHVETMVFEYDGEELDWGGIYQTVGDESDEEILRYLGYKLVK